MKKFILVFLLILGCGNSNLPQTTEPQVEINNNSVAVYTPPEQEKAKVQCSFNTKKYFLGPLHVREENVKGVYRKFIKVFPITISEHVLKYWLSSDYIFMNKVLIYSIQGDELNFIDWALISLQGEDVIWYDDWQVFYNGTIDIKPHIKNDHIDFEIKGRGMSPTQDTLIQVELDFLFLQNCKEE